MQVHGIKTGHVRLHELTLSPYFDPISAIVWGLFSSNQLDGFCAIAVRSPDWKGTNKLSLWVAIDDATVDNGCLKVVPESHRAVLPHEQHTEAIAFDSRVSADSIANEQMSVPLEAGSVLFFHDLLLHARCV